VGVDVGARGNKTDLFSDELAAVMKKYPPDNVAPVLSSKLVYVARRIGLSEQAVHDSIENLWRLLDEFEEGC